MNRMIAKTLLVGSLVVALAAPAFAIAPFKKVFFEVYVKPDSDDPNEKAFAALAKPIATGDCWICHSKWKKSDKHVRNNYGKALSEFLDRKNFSEDRMEAEKDKCNQEIRAALEKVAAMKSNPKDPNSPTFGELIKSGKLPSDGTPDPDDLKKAKEKDAKKAAEDE